MNKIVWFRNDLRVSNNDAFNEAAKSGKILPIYIFDKEYHKLPTSSSFHLDFLKSSLDDLSNTDFITNMAELKAAREKIDDISQDITEDTPASKPEGGLLSRPTTEEE